MEKRITLKTMIFGFLSLIIAACSAEDPEMELNALNASGTVVQAEAIIASDLVGSWTLHSMISDTLVNFNPSEDQISSRNIMDETECFDNMYFDFKDTGAVATRQSRLYFSAATGEFSCQTTGDYAATYVVNNNELSVTFSVDGQTYTEKKSISLFTESGNEYLKVTLTSFETNSAVYVEKDPGNTVASKIQEIEMVYIKQ